MNNGVYRIFNKITNCFYIGSTSDKNGFNNRFKKHKKQLKNNSHCNSYLQNAWNKYGESSFIFEILEICEKDKCIEREQFYIDTLKPEYNICKIAGSTLGVKHTEESKLKISQNRKYGIPWNKGLKMSKESRDKMSISQKISEKCKKSRKELSNSRKIPVYGIHIITGERIDLEYINQDKNFHASGIKASISGKWPSYKGYRWFFTHLL